MKRFLKTILTVSIMILGIVISQNTTNGTAPPPQNNTAGVPPPQNNGTAPPPQNNGNGVMRNGSKPEGPSNLPPQKPAITDKLAAITDTRLVNLKNILQYLPPIEQDLIADCFTSNTDTTRLLTPDCYVGNFTETIRKPVSKGFSDALTNSSSANRDGLSCLQKMANTFGNSTDNTTNIITTDIATVITQQVPLNQATSNFVTTVLNILNSRRKFLLTTTNLILQSISSNDTLGFAEGFVFTEADQTTIVTSFKVYANFLYSFFSNLNSKVNSIEGMIGKLDQCKPPVAAIAASKRLLQAATTSSTTNPPFQQGNNTGTNPPPQQGNNTGTNPPFQQGNNTQQQGNNTQQPPQGQQPMGNQTMNNTGGNPPPKNQNETGGKPQGKDGRPQNNIPQGITNLKSNVTALLATKTGSDWAYLNSEVTLNLEPSSGYRPNGGLLKSILERITNYNPEMKYEFSKINRSNETCISDYLFACKDGVCSCADTGCPTNLANVKQLTLSSGVLNAFNRQKLRYLQTATPVNTTAPPTNNTNGQQQPPAPVDLSSDDFPSNYYMCSVCLSGKRYIFSEAKLSKSGLLIDFNDGKGNSLGKQVVDQQNNCAQGLKSGNSTANLECRGSISDDCAKKMDNACASTGLYDILINNPVPASPLPTQCDDSLPTYTENNCFNWLVPKITKATIVFDYKGFLDLPKSIAISERNGGSLNGTRRILQTNTITVVKVDPVTQSDPKAVIPSTVSQVSTTEVVVDSTTVAAAASPTTYINSLTQTAAQVKLSDSYLQYSFTIFTLALIGLLI